MNFAVKNLLWLNINIIYSCESAIYFDLGSKIIKENCNFACYFNKTNIRAAVLDGGNEINFANLAYQ